PKDDGGQKKDKDKRQTALERIRSFIERIEKFQAELEQALEPVGDLEDAEPVTSTLDRVSDELKKYVDNDLTNEIKDALRELGVPVQQWINDVDGHREIVDKITE